MLKWRFEKPFPPPSHYLDGERLSGEDFVRIKWLVDEYEGPHHEIPALIQRELEALHKKRHPELTGQ